MKSLEEINELMRRAIIANLQGIELFAAYNAEDVRRAYNGIGPEFLPEGLRDRITQFLDLFAPAALIHDLRFDESNGTRYDFNAANMELHENCLTLAADEYPWWRHPLRRFAAREVAHLLYAAVKSSAGWQAWMDAREKNSKRKNQK